MEEHWRNVHQTDEEKFECSECHKLFPTKRGCDIHFYQVHEDDAEDAACPHEGCTVVYTGDQAKKRLKFHVKQAHGPNAGQKLSCPVCQKEFGGVYQRGHLQKHMKEAHEDPGGKVTCGRCGEEFNGRDRTYARMLHYRSCVKKKEDK